jgi:DNA-binding response OmpR family regulator
MEAAAHDMPLVAGELEVRPGEFAALASGRRMDLTVRELHLLAAFMRRPGRVVSRAELYSAVWGGPLRGGDRSVDVYVRKLRRKLAQDLPEWRFIHTHVGFGYRFAPSPSQLFHTAATDR